MNSFRAGATFPFLQADPTRAWLGWHSFGISALLAAQERNAIALVNANQAALDGLTAFARRQADLVTITSDDCSRVMGDVLSAATFEQKATRQAAGALHLYDSAVAGLRELSDIATRANVATADILSSRVREAFDEFKALLAQPVRADEPVNALPIPLDVEVIESVNAETPEEPAEPAPAVHAEPAGERKPPAKTSRSPRKKGRTRR